VTSSRNLAKDADFSIFRAAGNYFSFFISFDPAKEITFGSGFSIFLNNIAERSKKRTEIQEINIHHVSCITSIPEWNMFRHDCETKKIIEIRTDFNVSY